jgi:hypothetical protein
MVSGQICPSETSPTNATIGVEQLSDSSVTTFTLGVGISSTQVIVTATGLLAVGKIVSFMIILE